MTASTVAGTRRMSTWPTMLLLALMWVATLVEQFWVFGLVLLAWAAWDIANGESSFVQRIRRADAPVAFWAVESSWIAFGLLWIVFPS